MSNDSLKWNKKHRPKRYDEYIGNTHVVDILKRMLATNKVPQTLLFSGESGLGKTSIAFLLAVAMKCTRRIDGVACGECSSCQRLNEKLILDGEEPRNSGIYYVDITKANTVEEAKELVHQMKQKRFGNETSIYILDEMQRASQEAQSCFLKIAEDTPPNVYIFLCTTNPEKLLPPLINRFHQMFITKPTSDDLRTKLATICSEEGVNYSEAGLKLLIRKCNKVPRECINKAELVSISGDITVANVESELYLISEGVYTKFFDACFRGNLGEIIINVDEIRESENYTFKKFVNGLGDYLASLLEARAGIKIENYTATEIQNMRRYIQRFTDKQIIEIIKKLKEYGTNYETMDFKLLSLAVEIMTILNVEETVRDMNADTAGTRYVEVTNRVSEATETSPESEPSENDLSNLFNADRVVLENTPDNEAIQELFGE